jgi:hypothetical protein|uniref:RNase H type-1 domain-containing protein n=1 Tax=Sipha flava TaxID=143950 RepID=A0A2S2Q174_9HEMI
MNSLLYITNNPFLSKDSSILLRVRTALLALKIRSFTISFLWTPGHIGISGNEYADFLAGSITNQIYSGPFWCPYIDLVPIHRKFIQKLWKLEWDNLPESYDFTYKTVSKKCAYMLMVITTSIKSSDLNSIHQITHRPQHITKSLI